MKNNMKTFNQLTVGDKIYTTATVKPLSMVINGIAQRPGYLLFYCTDTNNAAVSVNRAIRNEYKDKISTGYTTTDYETAKRNCLKILRYINISKRKHYRI
jgi:hypothetical protein